MSPLRRLAAVLGFACLLSLVAAADAQKLKSPDGQLELTVAKDGTVIGKNKKTGKSWTFPPEGVDKAKNHKTAFAPKGSAGAKYGPTVFVAYGQTLYNLDASGKYRWTTRLNNDDDDKVTFSFVKDTVVVTVGDKKSTYDMVTGKKLK